MSWSTAMIRKQISLIKKAFTGWGMSREGWLDNRRGEWLLLTQVILISAHLFGSWPNRQVLPFNWLMIMKFTGQLLFLTGIYVAFQGFFSIGENLSPLPYPKEGSELVRTGAYKNCRHPIYKGVIMCSIGVVLIKVSLLHLLLLINLTILLVFKAKNEEEMLLTKFNNYHQYRKATPAIIDKLPFLDWRE